MAYDSDGNYVPDPLPGDSIGSPSVSQNGVPQPRSWGATAKNVGGALAQVAGNTLQNWANSPTRGGPFQQGRQARAGRSSRGSGQAGRGWSPNDIREALQPSQHFWQGEYRQAFGGVDVRKYDWRPHDLRPIHARPIGRPGMVTEALKSGMGRIGGERPEEFDPDYVNEYGIGTAKSGFFTPESMVKASNTSLQYSQFGEKGQQIRMAGKGDGFFNGQGQVEGQDDAQTIVGDVEPAKLQGSFYKPLAEPKGPSNSGMKPNALKSIRDDLGTTADAAETGAEGILVGQPSRSSNFYGQKRT